MMESRGVNYVTVTICYIKYQQHIHCQYTQLVDAISLNIVYHHTQARIEGRGNEDLYNNVNGFEY